MFWLHFFLYKVRETTYAWVSASLSVGPLEGLPQEIFAGLWED